MLFKNGVKDRRGLYIFGLHLILYLTQIYVYSDMLFKNVAKDR